MRAPAPTRGGWDAEARRGTVHRVLIPLADTFSRSRGLTEAHTSEQHAATLARSVGHEGAVEAVAMRAVPRRLAPTGDPTRHGR